jgi:cap1 methyltransferase
MDPTKYICKVRDSFASSPKDTNSLLPYKCSNDDISHILIDMKIEAEKICRQENVILINSENYNQLQKLKDNFNHPNFNTVRLIANPFENIGRSIFMNRAAIKLANIDAIFNIINRPKGVRNHITPDLRNFKYCDVAGGPGGFTEYLQYRLPNSYGYGITLHEKDGGIPWIEDRLDKKRFDISYGSDGTGNLYINADWFSNYVKCKEIEGVDLVVADGGFEIGDDARGQEILSSRLIMTEILVSLQVLKVGGNFVCKIFDTVSKISADLMFLISLCFREVHIFKPVSSRPANAERYVIGMSLRSNISFYIDLFRNANSSYKDNFIISSLFNLLPSKFEQWLSINNDNSLILQRETTDNIITLLTNPNAKIDIPEYNLYKCLIIWNLPDNKRSKYDKIKVYN